MLQRFFMILFLGLFGGMLTAAEFPSGMVIDSSGRFSMHGLKFYLIHFDQQWMPMAQEQNSVKPLAGFPVRSSGNFLLKGSWNKNFAIEEKITAENDSSFLYDCRLTGLGDGVATNDLALCLDLPATVNGGLNLIVDGKKVTLPEKFGDKAGANRLFGSDGVKRVEIPCAQGRIVVQGDFNLLIQDDRKYEIDNFSLRFRLVSSAMPMVKQAHLTLNVGMGKYATTPVSLSKVMNMGFADEVADDHKGGWTDQGPENDMRMLKPGNYNFFGLDFNLVDPTKNGGNSCLVLNGPSNPYFPKTAEVAVDGKLGKYLYLLHATGWTPKGKQEIGVIEILYGDGTAGRLPVSCGLDVGNWWDPLGLPNGLPVLTMENRLARVGLYLSKFPIEDKVIKSIKLISKEKCLWLIAALTGTTEDVSMPKQISIPMVIRQNAEWKPFVYDQDIVAGSIMDFSSLLDAPAGKYGMVKSENGKFVFSNDPTRRIKFYGVNLCFSANFLDKTQCEQLADRFVRMGYNSVRFHHFDALLVKKNGKNSTELDPVQLDKLEYLFHCLKQRGIYLTIDLYTIRTMKKGEIAEYSDVELGMDQIKGLAVVNDAVRRNWEDFSRNLLTHVNPYTGLAWKDDPALLSVSLINENTIYGVYSRDPLVVDAFSRKFAAWLQERKLVDNADSRSKYKEQFLLETYNDFYRKISEFARSLGVKCPLTDQNHWDNVALAQMRKHYDYVDIHTYFSHPTFPVNPWSIPVALHNRSCISSLAMVPLHLAPARIFGLPMMCTEFDFVSPNTYRAETGLLMGAYSALQDWDGIYRFTYSHGSDNLFRDTATYLFDVASSPSSAITEKMGVLLFLRGDVKRSEVCFPTLVSDRYYENNRNPNSYPVAIRKLGLIGQVGSIPLDSQFKGRIFNGNSWIPDGTVALTGLENDLSGRKWGSPYYYVTGETLIESMVKDGIINPPLADVAKNIFRSSTGELELDQPDGTFKVVTPRSEGAVLPANKSLQGKVLSVENNTAYAAFMATAMDGRDLAGSRRILLLHLTDLQNSNARFNDENMGLWEIRGQLPHLLRKGEAKITLKGDFAGYKLYAINLAGKRLAEVPFKLSDNSLSFAAENHRLPGGVVAYELVK